VRSQDLARTRGAPDHVDAKERSVPPLAFRSRAVPGQATLVGAGSEALDRLIGTRLGAGSTKFLVPAGIAPQSRTSDCSSSST
jgi:hypothetical protein